MITITQNTILACTYNDKYRQESGQCDSAEYLFRGFGVEKSCGDSPRLVMLILSSASDSSVIGSTDESTIKELAKGDDLQSMWIRKGIINL